MRLIPVALAVLCGSPVALQAEQRQVYSHHDSPPWLRAVGKLHVPGQTYHQGYGRHQQENCSATLVAKAGSDRASTIVTAWHCLEFYSDLSRPITFTLNLGSGAVVTREAYRVADGGGMHADWAVLKLFQAIPRDTAPALVPQSGRADRTRTVTMAGYSGDQGLGEDGAVLTYHADCRITRQAQRESASNCRAYKGASGGAVIQVNAEGKAQLSGVISRGDSQGISLFVPVAGFSGTLGRYLQ